MIFEMYYKINKSARGRWMFMIMYAINFF